MCQFVQTKMSLSVFRKDIKWSWCIPFISNFSVESSDFFFRNESLDEQKSLYNIHLHPDVDTSTNTYTKCLNIKIDIMFVLWIASGKISLSFNILCDCRRHYTLLLAHAYRHTRTRKENARCNNNKKTIRKSDSSQSNSVIQRKTRVLYVE